MKKYIYILMIVSLFSFSYKIKADVGVNLIQNPSMNIVSESQDIPANWNFDSFGNNKVTFTYPIDGFSGGLGAQINMTQRRTGDAKWIFDPVFVTPGANYTFSDYYKSTVNTKVTLQYEMNDGSIIYTNIGMAPASPNSWNQFTANFIAPDGATKLSILHRINKVGTLSVSDYYLADPPSTTSTTTDTVVATTTPDVTPSLTTPPIVLPPVLPSASGSSGPNLILNPSVESQTSGVPDNWFTDVEGTTSATFNYPVPGHTGNSAVQTVETSSDPNGDAKWIWAPVTVDNNGDYMFSEYYMSDVKSVLIVEFNMSDGTRQFTNLAVLNPASSWTQVQKEFNVRPGTVSVTVFNVLRNVGTLTIDDVALNKLPDGTFSQGLVSLSFDDGDLSFLTNALPILQSHNFPSTENIVNDFIGQDSTRMTLDQITSINKSGVEIDTHTVSHPFLTTLSSSDALQEIQNSKSGLASLGYSPLQTLAYPYGDFDDNIESMVKSSGYIGARSTNQGFNTRNSDLYALRTENVESDTTLDQVKQWIDAAVQNKTWLILAFHDVSDTPIDEYTITPGTLQSITDYLSQKNVKVLTTDNVINNFMK